MIKVLYILFVHLPELVELLRHIQENNQEAHDKKKLKEDIKVLSKAFKERDAQAIRNLFNS